MSLKEIVLETTKPETEWVRGRALRKVSPTYPHGLAQRRIAAPLGTWAEENDTGRVATEWRFRLTPPGEITRPLVPDVAFVSYAVLPKASPDEDVDVPRVGPTLAVEVLSPDDRGIDVRDKVRTYLSVGTVAVLIIDPVRRRALVFDAAGERAVADTELLCHAALPGFALKLATLFDERSARPE